MKEPLQIASVVTLGNGICLMLRRPIKTTDQYNRPQEVSLIVRDDRRKRTLLTKTLISRGYHCTFGITFGLFLSGTGYGHTVNEAIRAALTDFREHGGRNPEIIGFLEDAQRESWNHVGVYQGNLIDNRYETVKEMVTI